MKKPDQPIDGAQLNQLREGVREKYWQYHITDRDRYPAIEYNTNRINYEPLRASFEEEFYVKRGINRQDNNLHIPSSNTLALLFTINDYKPSRKILSTCLSYAEGQSRNGAEKELSIQDSTRPARSSAAGKVLLLSFVAISGLIAYLIVNRSNSSNGLTIKYPHANQTVPRLLIVEGTAQNADTVWLVVHPVGWNKPYKNILGWNKFFIQWPILVNSDGTWKGPVFFGSFDETDVGIRFQIQAFVHPEKKYRVVKDFENYVFNSWPEAELTSEAVEVIRGPNLSENPQ